MPLAHRRICGLCGRAYAIVLPSDKPENEDDNLCPECAKLPAQPDAVERVESCGAIVGHCIAVRPARASATLRLFRPSLQWDTLYGAEGGFAA